MRRIKAREPRRAIRIDELAWNAPLDLERMAARRAAAEGLVNLFGKELDDAIAALSTHSLRVGLTQDLFANGEDAGPISRK